MNGRLSDTRLCPVSISLHLCNENRVFVKFSDETAFVSLLLSDQDDHGHVVSEIVHWCDVSYLCLNVS